MSLILTSERLLLRPLSQFDMDVVVEMRTNPDVMKFFGGAETEEQIALNMRKYTRRCAEGRIGAWCVTDRSTEEKLGMAILLPLANGEDEMWDLVVGDDLPDCEIQIGFMLKRSAWDKGFATEASRRLLRFAFEDILLDELVATTHLDNTTSKRVLEKSGLVPELIRRRPGFRVTRQQWEERVPG